MKPALLVILGETAVGKSSLAIEVAQRLDGEIICADSWTVRREVNIGTDKPSKADRNLVPHHLLDIVGPNEDFTAALFKKLANKTIDEISTKQKLAIMVGGSGLYIDSVLYDYSFLKAGNREARQKLNNLTAQELVAIATKNSISLDGVDQSNKRRVIRAIETNGQIPKRNTIRENTLVIGIRRDPDELKELIQKRVDSMINSGLEQEVKTLALKYGWSCEALKGVGYKQWKAYFEDRQTLLETRQKIISDTLNLSKKQRTWFKRNKSIHWLNQPVSLDQIVDLTTTHLSR